MLHLVNVQIGQLGFTVAPLKVAGSKDFLVTGPALSSHLGLISITSGFPSEVGMELLIANLFTDAGSILRGYICLLSWVSKVHEGLFMCLVMHNATAVCTLHLCRRKCQWLLFVGYSLHYQALMWNWSSKWRIPTEGFWRLGWTEEMALHNVLASAPSTGRFLGIWVGFLLLNFCTSWQMIPSSFRNGMVKMYHWH